MEMYLVFGLGFMAAFILGFVIAWFWAKSNAKALYKKNSHPEAELKSLMAQQAQQYLTNSRNSLHKLETELQMLRDNVSQYEQVLSTSQEDESTSSFFGEHASVFLRNTKLKDNKFAAERSSDAQPRDFANQGSGLFVGHPALEEAKIDDKQAN